MSTTHNESTRATTGSGILDDVICGVSGSRLAYEAVRQGAWLTGAEGRLTLVAITAVRGSGQQRTAALSPERASRALRHAQRVAAQAGVAAVAGIDDGAPVGETLFARAREHGLLAIGPPTMPRMAHLLVGGTASAAAHLLPASLLIARRPPAGVTFGERLLVASDALEHSDALVDFAMALALARNAELVLLHAMHGEPAEHSSRLAGQVERVSRAFGDRAAIHIEPGRPRERIVAVAAAERCSLIVVSSRRLGGVRALGSVSERVAHDARCSVLVVRSEDLPA